MCAHEVDPENKKEIAIRLWVAYPLDQWLPAGVRHVPKGTKLQELVDSIQVRDRRALVALVNDKRERLSYELQQDDEVKIFGMVAGG